MEEEIKYYYSKRSPVIYSSDMGDMLNMGLTEDDLVEISKDKFDEISNPPDGKQLVYGDDGFILHDIPPTDYVSLASQERDELIAEANLVTYPAMLKMQMGRSLTDAEKAKVNAWLDYIDVLNDTDISDAPDVQWPTKPAA